MEKTLFILGAPDVEMQAIESLLKDSGLRYAFAAVGGTRCHPGNAYKADCVVGGNAHIELDCGGFMVENFTTIECGFPKHLYGCVPSYVIDHHQEGDPGYGKTPEEFFEASSIGQLISFLAKMGQLPDWPVVDADGLAITAPGSIQAWKDGWTVGDGAGERRIPDSFVMVAAADHCLSAAYRGQCPVVAPDALMQWRAESRAKFQKRPVAEVLADVENARQRLREAIADQVAKSGYGQASEYIGNGLIRWDNGSGYMEVSDCDFLGIVADLRGEHIPELPEASAREGIPFLALMTDRDGRKKVSIMGAGESLVRKFLAGELVAGLVDMYGDCARGFAGGYEA